VQYSQHFVDDLKMNYRDRLFLEQEEVNDIGLELASCGEDHAVKILHIQ
jgi:hypothetical protein